MSMSTEVRPKGGDLAVRAAGSRPVEILPNTSKDRGGAVRSASPASLALEMRRVWSRGRRGLGVPPSWMLIVLAGPAALMALIGLVIWRIWPDVHQVVNLRVDLLVEGVWRIGREVVANK